MVYIYIIKYFVFCILDLVSVKIRFWLDLPTQRPGARTGRAVSGGEDLSVWCESSERDRSSPRLQVRATTTKIIFRSVVFRVGAEGINKKLKGTRTPCAARTPFGNARTKARSGRLCEPQEC